MNTLLPLITNLATRKREYCVFVGAGFSKDAGVKSGWDILIETLKPLYISENKLSELPEDYYSKIENWYLGHDSYSGLGYSEILELMYQGDIERREYLRQFFNGIQPGEAHRQLALLVANRFIKFIFTTNFDDLIEIALNDIGVDYDVIFSDDILTATKSWDKVSSCRIYKLHGDYKTGKVKNTLSELESLESLIADDFQYIIDRHGLIVIGYAGRDKGVMNHFLKRKPYAYPIYWQYRNHPERTAEFDSYYKLIEKYEKKYDRKIQFIKCDSASIFLTDINNGIEKLERALIISKDKEYDYKEFIAQNDMKKVRALTLDLCAKFYDLYREYESKEMHDNSHSFRYENFKYFIDDIHYVFYYLDALLKYSQMEELNYFCNNIITHITDIEWERSHEFISQSFPYYIVMNFGALFLKNNCPELIKTFYDVELRYSSGNYYAMMDEISYDSDAWKYVGKEIYGKNYYFHKYSIIQEHLLPSLITPKDFNYFDAYIVFDSIMRSSSTWIAGSPMFSRDFTEVYFKYFKSRISNKQEAQDFIKKMNERYESFWIDLKRGIHILGRSILEKYGIE